MSTGELKPLANSLVPKSTFIKDMQTLYQTKKGTDINFKIMKPNIYGISGSLFLAHKASKTHLEIALRELVVASRAPGLAPACSQAPTVTKGQPPAVPLKGISPESFEALLKVL